jgi:hypothetical protein
LLRLGRGLVEGSVGVMGVEHERVRLGGNLKWRGRKPLRAHRPWHHEEANGDTAHERDPQRCLAAIVEDTA